MGKKRVIDMDGLCYDSELPESLGFDGCFLYQRLWSLAEDWGGFQYEPKWILFQMGAFQTKFTLERVKEILNALVELKKIILYKHGDKTYGWLKNFTKYQQLTFPKPPTLPLPPWVIWHPKRTPSDKMQHYEFLEPDAGDLIPAPSVISNEVRNPRTRVSPEDSSLSLGMTKEADIEGNGGFDSANRSIGLSESEDGTQGNEIEIEKEKEKEINTFPVNKRSAYIAREGALDDHRNGNVGNGDRDDFSGNAMNHIKTSHKPDNRGKANPLMLSLSKHGQGISTAPIMDDADEMTGQEYAIHRLPDKKRRKDAMNRVSTVGDKESEGKPHLEAVPYKPPSRSSTSDPAAPTRRGQTALVERLRKGIFREDLFSVWDNMAEDTPIEGVVAEAADEAIRSTLRNNEAFLRERYKTSYAKFPIEETKRAVGDAFPFAKFTSGEYPSNRNFFVAALCNAVAQEMAGVLDDFP